MSFSNYQQLGEVLQKFQIYYGDKFICNGKSYTIQESDRLFAAVNYVFQQCEIQLNQLVAA